MEGCEPLYSALVPRPSSISLIRTIKHPQLYSKVEKTTPLPWHMADRTHITVDTQYRSFCQSVQFYPGAPYLLVYVRASLQDIVSLSHSFTYNFQYNYRYVQSSSCNKQLFKFWYATCHFIVITNRYKKFVYFIHTSTSILFAIQ